jgi:hypothetical protein
MNFIALFFIESDICFFFTVVITEYCVRAVSLRAFVIRKYYRFIFSTALEDCLLNESL